MANQPAASPPSAMVDFVLRTMQVKTHVCTCQRHEHGYLLKPRRVRDYNLLFVTRGRPIWIIDSKRHEMQPQRLLVVRPGEPHRAICRTRRLTLLSLHVEAHLPGGGDVFDLLPPPRLQAVWPSSRLDRYLRGAIDEFSRPDPQRIGLMMRSWARLVVLELFADNAARRLLAHRQVDPLIAAVLEELTRHLDQPPALDDLAAWAGYSPQHLNRTFRRTLGVTPLQYLARMRMQAASRLLMEDRLSVAAIARKVGIDDPYYFSRLFKQHFGQSPTQYRDSAGSDSPS